MSFSKIWIGFQPIMLRLRTGHTVWGEKHRVTVEYIFGEGTLDTYVAELLSTKMALIQAVEMDEAPDASILAD